MRRLKVLMSAYACEPGRGSEPGVGWSAAVEMARHHDVWVVTRANNRAVIETELARLPRPGLRFIYWDLPRWARLWKRGARGVHLYYYLWQLSVLRVARAAHRQVGFDLVHHVTFVRYWVPSFLCLLGPPFIWGPVGGGERAPVAFWYSGGLRSLLFEGSRTLARWAGEHGPSVRMTARRCAIAFGTTFESAAGLRRIGAADVEIFSQIGLPDSEFAALGAGAGEPRGRLRFLSIGNLIQWKGWDLGLRAFARADISDAEYWLIGGGRDRRRLERLAARLGIAERVRFFGAVPRAQVLRRLGECDVLLHPSLHDSGGGVVIEAMAAGLPVICLDLGGPGVQVTAECGFKIAARGPGQAIADIAASMRQLAQDRELCRRLGKAARQRGEQEFRWSTKAEYLNAIYRRVLAQRGVDLTDLPAAAK